MKKMLIFALLVLLALSNAVAPVTANAAGENGIIKQEKKDLNVSKADKAKIVKEIASPILEVTAEKEDGTVLSSLNYMVQNVDTGEIISKGTTKNGKINSKITVGKMVKEAAKKKGPDKVNYTDYVLRVFNNDEEVYANHFFSVPVFNDMDDFINNVEEDELVDLLWVHKAHFGSTENNEFLKEAGYQEENNELNLTLNSADSQTKQKVKEEQEEHQMNLSTYCTQQSTTNARTKMGRVTGNENLEGELTIESGASLKIDVGVDGVASGSVTRSTNKVYTTPYKPSYASSAVVYGQYKYGKYSCQDRYVYPYNWTEVRALSFEFPDGYSVYTGIDGSTPSGTVGSLIGGQSYEYSVSNGYKFNAGATAYSVSLGTEVAYSSKNTIKFTSKGKGSKVFDRGTGGEVWYSTPIE